MRTGLLLLTLLAFALPVSANADSIADRAAAVNSQTQGNNSYDAVLARKLANIALEERKQHDRYGANEMMQMAEDLAAQGGGK